MMLYSNFIMNILEKIPGAATDTKANKFSKKPTNSQNNLCESKDTAQASMHNKHTFLLLIEQSTKGPKGLASPNICPSLKHTAT